MKLNNEKKNDHVSQSGSPQLARKSMREFFSLKSLAKRANSFWLNTFVRNSSSDLINSKVYRTSQGFTLIEVLVVSTLLLVFSAVVMIGYSSSSKTARDAQREKDIKQVQVALEAYYEIYHSYPVAGSMTALLSNANFVTFLQNSKIQDPLNTGSYVYTVTSNGTTYQLGYTKEKTQTQVIVNTLGH